MLHSLGRGHSDSAYILESSSEADLMVLTQRRPDIRRSREGVESCATGPGGTDFLKCPWHLAPLLLCKQKTLQVRKPCILLLLHTFSQHCPYCCPYSFAYPFIYSLSNVHEDKWPGLKREISPVLFTCYHGLSTMAYVGQ